MIANGEIGFDAIERILDAVGRKHVPIDINKGELHAGLVSCLAIYHAAVEQSSDKVTRCRIARLEKILGPAKRLQPHLPIPPDEDIGIPFTEAEHFAGELDNLIHALESKIADLNFERQWGLEFDEVVTLFVQRKNPTDYADRWKARSPFEWLAGHYLPELFRVGPFCS